MTATGNAELGFVALAHVLAHDETVAYEPVPRELHAPIRQDAVVLQRAGENSAARAVHEFLQSDRGAEIIRRFGYDSPAGQRE